MSLVIAIAERSMLLFGLIFFLVQLACYEVGSWFGRRHKKRKDALPDTVGVVVGGMVGLLAFVLALTLSFANSRYSDRQAGSLAEANAIGTAWLRAKAIGDPRGEAIAELLEDYAGVRAAFLRAGRDQAAIGAANERTGVLQTEIWSHLAGIIRDRNDAVANSLMVALNETFDASAAERFAFMLRLPPQMFWLLSAMTLLSMGSLGYQFGLRERPPRVLVIILTAMWTAVIVNILDLASGRLGYLRAGTAAYDWTLESMGASEPPR